MISRSLIAVLASAAVAAILVSPARANLLVNPGFEQAPACQPLTGSTPPQNVAPIPGWTLTDPSNNSGVSIGNPNRGRCAAFLGAIGANGTLSQQLTANSATGKYLVTFFVTSDGALPNLFGVTLGGQNIRTLAPYTPLTGDPYVYDFFKSKVVTIPNGPMPPTLTFTFRDDPGFIWLDDVAVYGVPEPSTWVMMLIGFGFIGVRLGRCRVMPAA